MPPHPPKKKKIRGGIHPHILSTQSHMQADVPLSQNWLSTMANQPTMQFWGETTLLYIYIYRCTAWHCVDCQLASSGRPADLSLPLVSSQGSHLWVDGLIRLCRVHRRCVYWYPAIENAWAHIYMNWYVRSIAYTTCTRLQYSPHTNFEGVVGGRGLDGVVTT